MTETAIAEVALRDRSAIIESVVIQGDLAKLTPTQRIAYYKEVCESLGLNPLTKPFDYITLNGKLTLYAKRDATDQLRRLHGVSIGELRERRIDDIYVVGAPASNRDGRTDYATGVVNLAGLKGEALANAMMKAETKAKRRVTLSICGLGWLDETETETIPDAKVALPPDASQHEALRALIAETQTDVPKLLAFFHVESLEDLSGPDYAAAMKMLETKKAKKGAA